jgi:hypothetical protein
MTLHGLLLRGTQQAQEHRRLLDGSNLPVPVARISSQSAGSIAFERTGSRSDDQQPSVLEIIDQGLQISNFQDYGIEQGHRASEGDVSSLPQ